MPLFFGTVITYFHLWVSTFQKGAIEAVYAVTPKCKKTVLVLFLNLER